MSTEQPDWYKNDEERALAEHLINLERASWDKWLKGDTSGYRKLCSERSFTYFDGQFPFRFEDHATLCKFLDAVDGKLLGKEWELKNPRVQFGKDMAVCTYQFFAKTNIVDVEYNVVEVYQKEEDGEWRVIHSTWSFIQPMKKDWKGFQPMDLKL